MDLFQNGLQRYKKFFNEQTLPRKFYLIIYYWEIVAVETLNLGVSTNH